MQVEQEHSSQNRSLGAEAAKVISLPGISGRKLGVAIQRLVSSDPEFYLATKKMTLSNSAARLAKEFEDFATKIDLIDAITPGQWVDFTMANAGLHSKIVEPLYRRHIRSIDPLLMETILYQMLGSLKEEAYTGKEPNFKNWGEESKQLLSRAHRLGVNLQEMAKNDSSDFWAKEIHAAGEMMFLVTARYSALHIGVANLLEKMEKLHFQILDVDDSINSDEKILQLMQGNKQRYADFTTLLSSHLLYLFHYYSESRNFFGEERETLELISQHQREEWLKSYEGRAEIHSFDKTLEPKERTTKKKTSPILDTKARPVLAPDPEAEVLAVADMLSNDFGYSTYCTWHLRLAKRVLAARKTSLDAASVEYDLGNRVEVKPMRDMVGAIYKANPALLLLSNHDLKIYGRNLDNFYKYIVSQPDKGNRLWTTILQRGDYSFFAPHFFSENVLKYWPELRLEEIGHEADTLLEINVLNTSVKSK